MDIRDLREMLKDDPLYKQVVAALPDDQRQKIEEVVLDFVTGMQSGAIEPMMAMVDNPEFVAAFLEVMSDRDPDRANNLKKG